MKKVLWYVGPWKGTGAIFAIFDLNFGLFFKFRENAAPLHYGLELLHKLWNLTPGILFFKREMAEIAAFIKVTPHSTNINRKFLM